MRRFSRRRRAGGGAGAGRGVRIDAERWLQRISGERILPVESFDVWRHDDIPESYAAIGRGRLESGGELIVSFAPRHAGDAVLAALAAGGRLAQDEEFGGEVVAVAPEWSTSARRRLGLVRAELPFQFRALCASVLADGSNVVEPEGALECPPLSVPQIAAQLAREADRELFLHAAAALKGLASKHGGSIRGFGSGVELVLLARRVAELRASDAGVVLTTLLPQHASARLTSADLAVALDGLEGQLRRRLNDRRVRDGEEGLRARAVSLVSSALSLRAAVRWPLGGSDRDDVDLVGVDTEGRPVVAAVRKSLGLPALGAILDAAQTLRASLPTLLGDAGAPLRFEPPQLVLAAEEFSPGALGALSATSLAHRLFVIRSGRHQEGLELVSTAVEEAARPLRERPPRARRRGGEPRRADSPEPEPEPEPETKSVEAALDRAPAEVADESGSEASRSRRRRRGRRRARPAASTQVRDESDSSEPSDEEAASEPHYEELSLFDLEEGERGDSGSGEVTESVRRRRGRSRRRGRRTPVAEDSPSAEAVLEVEDDEPGPRGNRDIEVADEDLADDLSGGLADLPEDLSGIAQPVVVEYQDDDGSEDEGDAGERERKLALERRRRERKVAAAEVVEVVETPKPPRRRAVVVAQAERDSLLGAILLARDIRLLEGLWIYPQSELMNFFREVATDLRDDVPIYLVGFTPSPARDVIQAATLYRDRLIWYDHHDWPPEDLVGLKDSIGEAAVCRTPDAGSSLPGVLATCTRRSRFSDKLVDLATGRFTEHDYERWGRLWWWRLGVIAQKTGDVRSDIEPLLSGRPSDLAKEAAQVETPPIPDEVAYVSGRDFRLVRYAGYAMVVIDAEGEHDLHLVGRIARERYGASLSLAYRRTTDLFFFGGEEIGGRRALDFGALALHLAEKLDWVEALPDDDQVARFRIRDLDVHPERLDEVIGEIAMGRSILER